MWASSAWSTSAAIVSDGWSTSCVTATVMLRLRERWSSWAARVGGDPASLAYASATAPPGAEIAMGCGSRSVLYRDASRCSSDDVEVEPCQGVVDRVLGPGERVERLPCRRRDARRTDRADVRGDRAVRHVSHVTPSPRISHLCSEGLNKSGEVQCAPGSPARLDGIRSPAREFPRRRVCSAAMGPEQVKSDGAPELGKFVPRAASLRV